MSKIRKSLARHHTNFKGWKTNRKIIVFESDDWGSIRMPSRKVYDIFLKHGIAVDESPYCKYDTLAGEEDLTALFQILYQFKDHKGNHPVITANCVVANPDFDRIEKSDFRNYFYEDIKETFKRYFSQNNIFEIWKEGIVENIFIPQSHGREHVNVRYWLKLLRDNNPDFRLAFKHRCWGLSRDIYPGMRVSIQASFDSECYNDITTHKQYLKDGLNQFKKIFGYISASFIANNFIWDSELNKTLHELGVKYLQGMKYQKLPIYDNEKRKMIRHFIGENNDFDQIYLIRNCQFEPSLSEYNYDSVDSCLKGISNAFFWHKPAIISTHRLNFIGSLNKKNRDRNLKQFDELLNRILKKWPNVEFYNSTKLGDLISSFKI